jgi:glycosyltransferase involved in cell wall biosynthesis
MRIHVVDPSAYTPPYDRALCAALAAAGVDVELFTSRFAYAPDARRSDDGFLTRDFFYRAALGPPASRLRLATKLAQHVPDMLRYRRAARTADLVHFQWLSVQHLDGRLLPRGRPLVLTAHDVLPREPRPGQLAAQRRLYDRFDAVVVHSEHGRERLTSELALAGERVHVIPHGVLAPDEPPGALPRELSGVPQEPVVLCFGLLRPYKGIDVLLEAWRGIDGAQLWIVGMPRMDVAPLLAAAAPNVRFVLRFVYGAELAACFERADLVVLPYREIDQSGVLFTALACGKPLLLSDVGGFPEVAAHGAARLVPGGDPAALHTALDELLADNAQRAALADAAWRAAAGPYAWPAIANRTRALYERLLS